MGEVIIKPSITVESSPIEIWNVYHSEMALHRAWRKRAEEAELALLAVPPSGEAAIIEQCAKECDALREFAKEQRDRHAPNSLPWHEYDTAITAAWECAKAIRKLAGAALSVDAPPAPAEAPADTTTRRMTENALIFLLEALDSQRSPRAAPPTEDTKP